jgi:hypothetical protein
MRVGRPSTGNDEQIALRITKDDLARAASLQGVLAPPGVAVNRSDVLRAAIHRGLDVLEGQLSRVVGKQQQKRKR